MTSTNPAGEVPTSTAAEQQQQQHPADDKFERSTMGFSQAVADAKDAYDVEHRLTVRQALRLYPSACLWSLLFSTAVIMEDDVVLLGTFYGFPQFVKKYGYQLPDGSYNISPSWQSGLSNGVQVGEIIGLWLNGYINERYGYRKTMLGALTLMIAFIFFPFFAPNIKILLVGEILQGIPWGIFQTLPCTYAADIAPVALRPLLTTYVNLCWVMGQLLASGVLRALLHREDQWSYRIPFALQWMWPVPLIIGVLLAPESPLWLVRRGRIEDAKAVVRRLTRASNTGFDVDKNVALMVHTNEQERLVSEGTSYLDCFRGIDRRRTEIAVCTWVIQNWSGSSFNAYSNYFLQQAGMDIDKSFDLSMGNYAIGFVGTILSWWLMQRMGRRDIYLSGLAVMSIGLLIIGFLGLAPNNNSAIYAVGGMLLLFTFVYDLTIGPVCYCIVSEISSTRLRTKTVSLARNVYNVAGIVNNIIMPRFINVSALNWGAKTGWFWGGMAALCFLWSYFRLPEARGRTSLELDKLFEHKVSARKFASTTVDAFDYEHKDKTPTQYIEQAQVQPVRDSA